MEPWQYSSLQTKYSSLLQLLSSSSQNSRTNHSPNSHPVNDQAMNIDSCGDETLKTGIKRKLSHSDEQANFTKKTSWKQYIGGHTKLALDVYTQTNASYVADKNRTLEKITELVLENSRRLDSIENVLTSIDKKISLFGSESSNIDRHPMKPALTVEMKPASTFHPVTTSTPALSFISDVETANKATFCQTVTNMKSPVSTVGHSEPVNNAVLLQGIPVTAQPHSDNGWSQINLTQGMQAMVSSAKLTNQDSRSELQTKVPDVNEVCNVLVPVIFASEDKTRRCATTEVVLQDLLNGNVTNSEDSIQIFRGCWLGDRLDPHSRVWYYGDSKLIQRAEASGSNPAKLSLNLLEALFTREEMAASNVNGARGRELLDLIKIKAIYAHINYKFPADPDKQELRWHFLKPRIDSKCRAQRRIQRDHQAVGDGHNSNIERPFRNKLSKPSLDPKIKEELLYGFIKSDAGVPSQVVNTCNGSGANENTAGDVSGNVQTSANPASLVYENSTL